MVREIERQVEEAMRNVEGLFARNASFAELIAAIDACAAMPGASPVYMPGIQAYRVTALDIHGRPDDELRPALDHLLELEQPLLYLAWSVIAACADRAALAADYLPPLIARLHAANANAPDEALAKTLDNAHQVCKRLGVAMEE